MGVSEHFALEGGQAAWVRGRPWGLDLIVITSLSGGASRCIQLLWGIDLVIDCQGGPQRRAAREQWLRDAAEKSREEDFETEVPSY